MSYISTVNNKSYRVDTGENNPRRDVLIEEASYSLDWCQIASLVPTAESTKVPALSIGGRYSLIIAGKSYEVFARRIDKPSAGNGQTYEIQFAGQHFEVHVEDEREKTLAGVAQSSHDDVGEVIVHAPMPGLVLDVPLEIGASVVRGQTVIVLEAMKMENDLASPRAGIIKEIPVSKGQTVSQGDVLVVIAGE